jgi:uridine kinase
MTPIFVGLTGFSGAGKSTLAEHLEAQGGIKRFRFDSFYKNEDECPRTQDGRLFWDLPESYHLDEAYEALLALKQGDDIFLPIYDRGTNSRKGSVLYKPAPIIFTEGLMLFTDDRIRGLFDLKFFLDVSEEIATQRRLQRQPGYDLDYHAAYAIPMARKYVAPAKDYADVVIDGTPSIPIVAAHADAALQQHLGVLARA